MKRLLLYLSLCFISLHALAFQDPTGGKAFLPWLWEDQFKPTIEKAGETSSLYVLGAGVALTATSFSYDDDGQEFARHAITMDQAQIGSILGGGSPGVGIAILQLVFDQKNGLAHGRALSLTAATHITIAALTRRERPNGSPTRLSFPSGHASSIFATATSLAYSYGPVAGTLAYSAAIWNGLSRIREEAHWVSDVVAGASLGIYWGRASAMLNKEQNALMWLPVPLEAGGAVVIVKDF